MPVVWGCYHAEEPSTGDRHDSSFLIKPMYQIAIYLYLLGVAVYSCFNEKVRKMWRGEREAIDTLKQKVDPNAKYVWFHAASLGEFEQGRPLMEQLRHDHPEYKILLTFFSPSGYEVRKGYEGADIITYLPLDTIRNARRFLRAVRPVMAFFIKYEFWYNYLHILKHRGVPVYSVSSIFRPGQVFFRWYGRQYSRVLKCFTHFFVQNEQSRDLLASIGITDVSVVGDTRFDRVLQIKSAAKQLTIVEDFLKASPENSIADRPVKVFVAGSSWEPDEDVYLPYFTENRNWKLIVATHVVSRQRIEILKKRLKAFGLSCVCYTDLEAAASVKRQDGIADASPANGSLSANVLLVDCYGLLSSIYQYGDVAYVGGGFGVGIHNILEAAVWQMPVIFGPNNQRFQEAQDLKAAEGGFEVGNAADFQRVMRRLEDADCIEKSGRAAGEYVESRAGATRLVLAETLPS